MGRSILLPLAIAGLSFIVTPAHSTTVTVPDDVPTLQAAIDSVRNSTIDTVYVRPGVITDSLYAILPNLTVIGLGDSLTRPSVGRMTINTNLGPPSTTFVNLRFTGLIRTVGKASIAFRDCRIEAGLSSIIDGSNRNVFLDKCRFTGSLTAVEDIYVSVDSCWFDNGAIVFRDQGDLSVTNSTFTGPGNYAGISVDGEVGVEISRNTFRGIRAAVNGVGESTYHIQNNVIENCDAGIVIDQGGISIVGNHVSHCTVGIDVSGRVIVADNVITDCAGDGIRFHEAGNNSRIERNVVARAGHNGLFMERTVPNPDGIVTVTVRNNTILASGASGFAFQIDDASGANHVTHNIGYGNGSHGLISLGAVDPTLSCNDWFGNDSVAVAGMDPSPDDLALDPLFCDIDHDNVTLASNSPVLDAPGCGLIGARGLGCASTPSLVTLFTAERDAEGVRVRWQLADPTRLAEVWIERADAQSGPWIMIVAERATGGDADDYLDREVSPENEYWYRLVAREGNEVVVIGEPLRVEANVARRFELTRVAPNPGSGPLRISFTLAHEAAVEVDVFDVQGRHLASLVRGSLQAGAHVVEWSGFAGTKMAPSTLQLVRYRYPGGQQVLRFVRVR